MPKPRCSHVFGSVYLTVQIGPGQANARATQICIGCARERVAMAKNPSAPEAAFLATKRVLDGRARFTGRRTLGVSGRAA